MTRYKFVWLRSTQESTVTFGDDPNDPPVPDNDDGWVREDATDPELWGYREAPDDPIACWESEGGR